MEQEIDCDARTTRLLRSHGTEVFEVGESRRSFDRTRYDRVF
jgi:hypothetical protein